MRGLHRVAKLATSVELRGVVEDRLGQQWSLQQISRCLRVDFPSRPEMQVSHETIYLSLFVQGRGALRKELTLSCVVGTQPGGLGRTRPTTVRRRRGGLHISRRPAEVEDRAVPGHRKGDLLLGTATAASF